MSELLVLLHDETLMGKGGNEALKRLELRA